MTKWLSTTPLVLVLVLALVACAEDARAAFAFALALTPLPATTAIKPLTYDEGVDASLSSGQRLAVWVNQDPADWPGWVHCRWDAFPGIQGAAVVLAAPNNRGFLDRLATVPGRPTNEEILKVVAVPQPVVPVVGQPRVTYSATRNC